MAASRPESTTDGWPQSASKAITDFLGDLRAVGRPEGYPDNGVVTGRTTPYSLQDLTSGATALTKVWTPVMAVFGGGPALWAMFKGFVSDSTTGPGGSGARVALIAGGSALLCVVALAIALIIRGDVASRATVRAARHHAEGQIVSAALTNYNFSFPTGFIIRKGDNSYLPVQNIARRTNGDVVITTVSGETLEPDQYDAILPASDILTGLTGVR